MSIKKIQKTLKAIANNKEINLLAFQNMLEKLKLHHRFSRSDIDAIKTKGQKYIVRSINHDLLAELQLLVDSAGNDRISAAQQNLSHAYNVLGSFIVMRPRGNELIVVSIDSSGIHQPNEMVTDSVLLIENRQLFISVEATISFLHQTTDYPKNEDIDVIFTAGNEISNVLHRNFLAQYKNIYCLLDLDLGGLMIAKNLYDLLDDPTLIFLVPNDIEQRLHNVVLKCDAEYINKVLKLGQQQPKLQHITRLIAKHHKVLEQEAYLHALK